MAEIIPGLSDADNAAIAQALAKANQVPAPVNKMSEEVLLEMLSTPKEFATDGAGMLLISDEPVKPEGFIQNSGIKEGRSDKEILVPHVPSEDLDANLPSRGKKMVPVTVPTGIGRGTFLTLLSNAYALYVTTGNYTNEKLQARTGLTEGAVGKVISSPEFKYALRMRGVTPDSRGLTYQQDLAIQVLSDPSDGKNLQQKLKVIGISYSVYRGWMKQPAFKEAMSAFTNDTLFDNTASITQLSKLVGQGDLPAIKYFHELNGTYDPNRQQSIDVIALMSKMLEIISKHVKDPAALEGVAKEFQQVAVDLQPKQIGG